MKLQEARDAYYEATGQASAISRQLAFAALAVIWIFKTNEKMAIPGALFYPSALAILTLALDLLQYVYKAIAWGVFSRAKEKALKHNEEAIFKAPTWINWPAIGLITFKICAVVACHVMLLRYLLSAVAH